MQKWAGDMAEDKPLPRYVNDNDFVVADALRGCKIRANDRGNTAAPLTKSSIRTLRRGSDIIWINSGTFRTRWLGGREKKTDFLFTMTIWVSYAGRDEGRLVVGDFASFIVNFPHKSGVAPLGFMPLLRMQVEVPQRKWTAGFAVAPNLFRVASDRSEDKPSAIDKCNNTRDR